MSVAVVSSCTTAEFWPFLVPWAHAVSRLNREPDEIAIVSDAPEYARANVDALIPVQWIEPSRTWQHHAAYLVNDAIAATSSEWIAKLDIDDLALPGYLDGIDDTDADVWCVGYEYGNHSTLIADWSAEAILRADQNLLASCSPFRRWLWQAHEWPDSVYDDWVFWLRCAKSSAVFRSSHGVGYRYVSHPRQTTRRADLVVARQQVAAERW